MSGEVISGSSGKGCTGVSHFAEECSPFKLEDFSAGPVVLRDFRLLDDRGL